MNYDGYFDEELTSIVYNVTNQSQVTAIEIKSEVSISFQLLESGIVSHFPTLGPSAYLPSHHPACLPLIILAALTAASSSSLLTDLPAAVTAASSLSVLTEPSAALTATLSFSLPTDQSAVPTVGTACSP